MEVTESAKKTNKFRLLQETKSHHGLVGANTVKPESNKCHHWIKWRTET